MILSLYLHKLLTPTLVIAFSLIGVVTFDYAEHFSRWFLIALVVLALANIKAREVNKSGLLMIIIFERLMEEITYPLLNNFDLKVFIYITALVLLYKFKYDKLVKYLCAPFIVLIIIIELFWQSFGYNSPRLHPYIFIMLLSLTTRHLLFMRVPITDGIAKGAKSLALDWKLYDLYKWNVFVIVIMLVEYLIRHLTPLSPLQIYNAYTPVMHGITIAILFFLVNDFLRSRFILNA